MRPCPCHTCRVKKWLLTSAALGLLAVPIADVWLVYFQSPIRMLGMLIWPAGIALMGNEDGATSAEVATNWLMAIGGNVLIYVVIGSGLFAVKTIVQAVSRKVATWRVSEF